MPTTRYYCVDRADGTLDSQLLSSATSGTFNITLVNSLGTQSFNATAGYKILVTIENEQILCSAMSIAGSTVTLTIQTRGFNGTSAATHASGTTLSFNVVAYMVQQTSAELYAVDQQMQVGLITYDTVPTVTSATVLTFNGADVTALFTAGRVILYKISGTWYRAVIRSSSFSTNTTVNISGDGLPSSGTITNIGFEYAVPSYLPHNLALLKALSAVVGQSPPAGYVFMFPYGKGLWMKDEDGKVRPLNKIRTSISSSGGTLTIDCSTGNVFDCTLTENITGFTFSNGTDGEVYIVRLKQHASSAKTVVIGTSGKARFGDTISGFTMSTGLSKVDILTFTYDATADKYDLTSVLQGQA